MPQCRVGGTVSFHRELFIRHTSVIAPPRAHTLMGWVAFTLRMMVSLCLPAKGRSKSVKGPSGANSGLDAVLNAVVTHITPSSPIAELHLSRLSMPIDCCVGGVECTIRKLNGNQGGRSEIPRREEDRWQNLTRFRESKRSHGTSGLTS